MPRRAATASSRRRSPTRSPTCSHRCASATASCGETRIGWRRSSPRARGRRARSAAASWPTRATRWASGRARTPDPRARVRRLVWLVGAVVLVDTMFYAAITPLLPELADRLDLGKGAAGVLMAAYAAGTPVGALPRGGAGAARRVAGGARRRAPDGPRRGGPDGRRRPRLRLRRRGRPARRRALPAGRRRRVLEGGRQGLPARRRAAGPPRRGDRHGARGGDLRRAAGAARRRGGHGRRPGPGIRL